MVRELPVVLMDSREKGEMIFKRFKVKVKPLRIGKTLFSFDYTIEGHEDRLGIEYKSHADLYQSIFQNHDHFFVKMKAMRDYVEYPVLAIGATPQQVMIGCVAYKAEKWQRARKVTTQGSPGSVLGNLIKLSELGFRVRFCKSDRQKPAKMIEDLLNRYLHAMKVKDLNGK